MKRTSDAAGSLVQSRLTKALATLDIIVGGDRPWDLQVHDHRFWAHILRGPDLALGETYQAGWWNAEAPDQLIARLLTAELASGRRPTPNPGEWAPSPIANRQAGRRSQANAAFHYDIGNDLFERMLDRRMIYSCGYWADAEDLESAQVAKMNLISRKLGLQPGMRLLDLGCGWGGFARYAAETHDVRVTAVTPSLAQAAVATGVCRDLDVEVCPIGYHDVTGTFDRIVSIGMIEHVGRRNLREFFVRCGELLEPEGMMLHHFIGARTSKQHTNRWITRHVFPGGFIPSLAQIARASEQTWTIEDVHNFGPDYDRTLMAWERNIRSRWAEIPHYDETFRRTWRFYLLSCAAAFRARVLSLNQVVFRRNRRAADSYVAHR